MMAAFFCVGESRWGKLIPAKSEGPLRIRVALRLDSFYRSNSGDEGWACRGVA